MSKQENTEIYKLQQRNGKLTATYETPERFRFVNFPALPTLEITTYEQV